MPRKKINKQETTVDSSSAPAREIPVQPAMDIDTGKDVPNASAGTQASESEAKKPRRYNRKENRKPSGSKKTEINADKAVPAESPAVQVDKPVHHEKAPEAGRDVPAAHAETGTQSPESESKKPRRYYKKDNRNAAREKSESKQEGATPVAQAPAQESQVQMSMDIETGIDVPDASSPIMRSTLAEPRMPRRYYKKDLRNAARDNGGDRLTADERHGSEPVKERTAEPDFDNNAVPVHEAAANQGTAESQSGQAEGFKKRPRRRKKHKKNRPQDGQAQAATGQSEALTEQAEQAAPAAQHTQPAHDESRVEPIGASGEERLIKKKKHKKHNRHKKFPRPEEQQEQFHGEEETMPEENEFAFEEEAEAVPEIEPSVEETSEEFPLVRKSKKKPKKKPKKEVQEEKPEIYEPPQVINPEKLLTLTQRINPEISRFLKKLDDFLENEVYVNEKTRIVCAVSGGVDSITMLDALAVLQPKYHYRLYVAHFNHKLREETADQDEAFVRSVAESYNLPVYTGQENVKQFAEKNSLSIEQAARKLRYRFLEHVAKSVRAGFIFTAHTADDMVETFFLNLFRGSGLTGLSGIPAKRVLTKNMYLARPFLGMKKTDMIDFAKRRNLGWHEDETNSLMFYLRNKVRHDLLPKLCQDYSPSVVDVINRTIGILRGADRFISERVSYYLKSVVDDKMQDRFSLKLTSLLLYNDFIKGELIQTALLHNFKIQPVSLQAVDRILALVDSPVGSIAEVTKKIMAVRDRDEIIVARKSPVFKLYTMIDRTGEYTAGKYKITLTEVKLKEAEFSNDPFVEYFDLEMIPHLLFLRSWEQGDVFKPLGMSGTVKLSDFLTNNKISLLDKQGVFVLATKSEIIWVCGMRISEKYKVTEFTDRVLKAEITEIK